LLEDSLIILPDVEIAGNRWKNSEGTLIIKDLPQILIPHPASETFPDNHVGR
jgi:hypothetical protein